MKPATFVACIVLAAAGIVMFLLVRGADIPLVQPMGPIALAQYRVILVTFALSSIVVVPVFFLLFYFAWKYRAHSPESAVHHHPTWDHDNPAAEFVWWLVPSAIIFALGIVAWQSSHALDPYVPIAGDTQMEVQVIALNWKWLFLYPDQQIAAVNELVIPVGVPVRFMLTADAPINSFWIPSLGGQIMVMPGMQTQLYLRADEPGTFNGWSGNLSGKGFSKMTFKTRALPKEQFDDWVARVQAGTQRTLDTASYAELARESEGDPVSYYFPFDAGLYTSVYMKYMQGAEKAHGHAI